jgi:alpha-tubulin suppressor-like RCC1 family protein
VPAPSGLRNVVDVRAISGTNGVSAVALTADGHVTAWGAKGGGVTAVPSAIQGHVTAIDAGSDYVMALDDQGKVWQWGNSSQVSSGLQIPADIQGKVIGISVSKDAGVSPGGKVSAPDLALLKDGTVRAWGTPLASSSAWTVPPDIQGIGNIEKVVTGPAPAAILKDGSIRFWGPVSDGTDRNSQGCDTTPVVPGDTVPWYAACGLPQGLAGQTVTDLRLGSAGKYAMALTETGEVYLWGGYKGSTASADIDNDTAMQVNWTGPVRAGVSAIGLDDTGARLAAVVTTGFAIGSDPVVSGTTHVGQTLAGAAGTFSGPQDYSTSSQWLANGVPITGATGSKLTLTSAYLGKRISYRTTAVSGSDTLTATSTQTTAVVKPTPPAPHGPTAAQKQQLAKDQAKLKHDQAKLKKLKKSFKKAHGAKKAKLKKKIAKLKKTIKADQKKVAVDKSKM